MGHGNSKSPVEHIAKRDTVASRPLVGPEATIGVVVQKSAVWRKAGELSIDAHLLGPYRAN
jgi:hypothetical protein